MHTTRHNSAVRLSRRVAILLLAVWGLASFVPPDLLAQGCAMCQTLMPHANEPMARGMFWSVLFLVTAPFAVGISIGGWLFYQHWSARQAQRTTAPVSPLHLAYAQKEGQP